MGKSTPEQNERYRANNLERERERSRAYYAANKEARLEAQRARRAAKPAKHKARKAIQHAIRSGKVKRQPCEECGTHELVHAHHDDYSKQLDVRWLCAKHHSIYHARGL
jgi:hypothetical protein